MAKIPGIAKLYDSHDDDNSANRFEQFREIIQTAKAAYEQGRTPFLVRYNGCDHPGYDDGFGLLFLPSLISTEVDFGYRHLKRADAEMYAQRVGTGMTILLGIDHTPSSEESAANAELWTMLTDDAGDLREWLSNNQDNHGAITS